MIKQKYDIYINTMGTGLIKAAEVALVEESGRLRKMGLKYSEEFMDTKAGTLVPGHLPLKRLEQPIDCSGGFHGVLDDYLPDEWGRKVLTKLALIRDKQRLNSNSAIDVLTLAGSSRIGALQWVTKGDSPHYELGVDFKLVREAERAAQIVDSPGRLDGSVEEIGLLYLANAGSGAGGARPKALLTQNGVPYLAKFNRLGLDQYNNARVELACLKMAAAAGLNVKSGHIEQGINGREVLMLERFDVTSDGAHRNHLVTVNAILKSDADQSDIGEAFRYDDIAKLIRKYSSSPDEDLQQLIRAMMFNRLISNTDDHERNFSFMNEGYGYRLAPSYDMVPSAVTGQYHAAGYGYALAPPTPHELTRAKPIFGLSKPQCRNAADQVMEAVNLWKTFAERESVSPNDLEILKHRIKV